MSESHNERIDVPELTADEIQARVLHRDGLMLVIDKPAGLPVHRGPKGGANLEASFDGLRFGLPRPPVLAHRLDKDTSGCLVLGRHRKATASPGSRWSRSPAAPTNCACTRQPRAGRSSVTISTATGLVSANRSCICTPA